MRQQVLVLFDALHISGRSFGELMVAVLFDFEQSISFVDIHVIFLQHTDRLNQRHALSRRCNCQLRGVSRDAVLDRVVNVADLLYLFGHATTMQVGDDSGRGLTDARDHLSESFLSDLESLSGLNSEPNRAT